MLKFDAETRELLTIAYHGSDVMRRRLENLSALAPAPGECILDLGCGQGMLTEELARAVGPTGAIVGVDPSPDMRADAAARCANLSHVRILEGRAGAVPVPDTALDAAVSVQVFEYVPDVPKALADLHRALRPGGRLVIGDMQFDTMSLASDDPERMARMCSAWDQHVHEANLPARLPHALQLAGFELIDMCRVPFVARTLRPDGIAFMLIHLMRSFAVQNGHMQEDDAADWFDEQMTRAEEGRFFFAITHFIAIARRL